MTRDEEKFLARSLRKRKGLLRALKIEAQRANLAPQTPAPITPPDDALAALATAIEGNDEEAIKAEFEKVILEHPELPDETFLGAMREVVDIEKGIDPSTAAARERCRQMGIGDFAPNRPKKPPVAIPETDVGLSEAWLHRVLERRRAVMAERASQQPQRRAPVQHSERWGSMHGLDISLGTLGRG